MEIVQRVLEEWRCGGDPGLARTVCLVGVLAVLVGVGGLSGCGGESESSAPTVATEMPPVVGGSSLEVPVSENASGKVEETDAGELNENSLRALADTNGDGRVSKEEFLAHMTAIEAERPPKPAPTAEERHQMLEMSGLQPMVKYERIKLLRLFDRDGDGKFSESEKAEAQAYLDQKNRVEEDFERRKQR